MGKNRSKKLKVPLLLVFLAAILFAFFEAEEKSTVTPIEGEIGFYATEGGKDLRTLYLQAIQGAKKSITLSTFSFNDPQLIRAINEKAESGVAVTVIFDAGASPDLPRYLGKKVVYVKRKGPGLTHLKLMVVDHTLTFVGSSNLTTASLKYYGNLVNTFTDPTFAVWIEKNLLTMTRKGKGDFGGVFKSSLGQFYWMPKASGAEEEILRLMIGAKRSIKAALFTWTRMDFVDALLEAKKRGVAVEVVLDRRTALGVGRAVLQRLFDGNVPLRLSQSNEMLHYKMMVVDESILVNGSANWTKSAFTKNDDCFMIMSDLQEPQKQFLRSLWKVILAEGGSPLTDEDMRRL